MNDPVLFVHYDLQFHDVLNQASGNPFISFLAGAMYECIEEPMREGFLNLKGKEEKMEFTRLHSRIVDAVEARNSNQAGILMKRHFNEMKRLLFDAGSSIRAKPPTLVLRELPASRVSLSR